MSNHPKRIGLAAILLTATVAAVAVATDPPGRPAAAEPTIYRPVTSDLMNAVIQPRHIKLWQAGKTRNWEYTEYERHNIGGALARIAAAIPTYKDQSTADLIAAFASPQLAELQIAIKTRNEAAFVAAYTDLTTGCNQCHQATDHAIVVMQTPDSNSFPDQVFIAQAH